MPYRRPLLLLQKVRQVSILRQLQRRGWKRLLLAVSGGVDSVCLAHYFVQNQKDLGFDWIAFAHVHHGLRKETADRDEAFVKELARQLNVPLFIHHLDGESLKASGSVEENARKARYKAFFEIAARSNCRADAILTAHHANDQAETLLMRLRRGTSLKGLRGIQFIRNDGVYRPFLNIPRSEIEAYAVKNHLSWCEDETNADKAFERNFIRHAILPRIEAENVQAVKQLCRIAQVGSRIYEKILCQIEQEFEPQIVPPSLWPFPEEIAPYEHILALHDSAWDALSQKSEKGAAELLRIWLQTLGFEYPNTVDFKSNFANRNKSLIFEKSRHILWFCRSLQDSKAHNLYLFEKKRTPLGEWRFRLDGDVYTPPSGRSKSLKKWFEDNGVPAFVRDCFPVFSDGKQILQIYGIPPRIKETYE